MGYAEAMANRGPSKKPTKRLVRCGMLGGQQITLEVSLETDKVVGYHSWMHGEVEVMGKDAAEAEKMVRAWIESKSKWD